MLLLQGIQKVQKLPKVLSPDSFLADSNLLIENDSDKDYIKSLIFNPIQDEGEGKGVQKNPTSFSAVACRNI